MTQKLSKAQTNNNLLLAEYLFNLTTIASTAVLFLWISTAESSDFSKASNPWVKYVGYVIIAACCFLLITIGIQLYLKYKEKHEHRQYSDLILKSIATVLTMVAGIFLSRKFIYIFSIFLILSTCVSIIRSIYLSNTNRNAKDISIILLSLIQCFALITFEFYLSKTIHVSHEFLFVASIIGSITTFFLAFVATYEFYLLYQSPSDYEIVNDDNDNDNDNGNDNDNDNGNVSFRNAPNLPSPSNSSDTTKLSTIEEDDNKAVQMHSINNR